MELKLVEPAGSVRNTLDRTTSNDYIEAARKSVLWPQAPRTPRSYIDKLQPLSLTTFTVRAPMKLTLAAVAPGTKYKYKIAKSCTRATTDK